MVPAQEVDITVDYVHSGKIQNELLNAGIILKDTEYLENVTFRTILFPEEMELLRQTIQEFTANEFTWLEGSEVYRSIPV